MGVAALPAGEEFILSTDALTTQVESRRNAQIERRLNELGSMVKGNQDFQADRISDVIEQIDELRAELKRVADRQDKIAEFIKANRGAGGG